MKDSEQMIFKKPPPKLTLGERVRWARKARGWSGVELCRQSNIDPRSLSSLERRGTISSKLILPIAEALNCNHKWLMQGEGEPFFSEVSDEYAMELEAKAVLIEDIDEAYARAKEAGIGPNEYREIVKLGLELGLIQATQLNKGKKET